MNVEVPESIRERLSAAGVPDRDILHAVSSDLCLDGRYGEDWAVATPTALHVVTARDIDSLALDRIGPVQVESLVSGGLLTAGRDSAHQDPAERLLLRFSNSRARQFGAFAGAVAALQKGDEPPAAEAHGLRPEVSRSSAPCSACRSASSRASRPAA